MKKAAQVKSQRLCVHCNMLELEHAQKKCFFGPTTFRARICDEEIDIYPEGDWDGRCKSEILVVREGTMYATRCLECRDQGYLDATVGHVKKQRDEE